MEQHAGASGDIIVTPDILKRIVAKNSLILLSNPLSVKLPTPPVIVLKI